MSTTTTTEKTAADCLSCGTSSLKAYSVEDAPTHGYICVHCTKGLTAEEGADLLHHDRYKVRAPFGGWTLRLNWPYRLQMARQGLRSLLAAMRGGPSLVPRTDPWAIFCSGCGQRVPSTRNVGRKMLCADCVTAASEAKLNAEDHFGTCPDCGKTDGYINIGRSHWFYCAEHKTRWLVGSNLFDSWKDQTEDEQRARYDELDFGSFAYIAWTETEARDYDAHCAEPPANPTRVRASA